MGWLKKRVPSLKQERWWGFLCCCYIPYRVCSVYCEWALYKNSVTHLLSIYKKGFATGWDKRIATSSLYYFLFPRYIYSLLRGEYRYHTFRPTSRWRSLNKPTTCIDIAFIWIRTVRQITGQSNSVTFIFLSATGPTRHQTSTPSKEETKSG